MPVRARTYQQMLRRLRPPQAELRLQQRPPDLRPSRIVRGYDAQWLGVSRLWRKQHPLCAECQRRGRLTPAQCVDHIKPFSGLEDPLRFDPDNLQSLCWRCHNRKTAKQTGAYGRGKRLQEPIHG